MADQNNEFTIEERNAFVRALKSLVANDVRAVAETMGLRLSCSQNLSMLRVLVTVYRRPILEAEKQAIIDCLSNEMRSHAYDYAALLGDEQSDFSRLATVAFFSFQNGVSELTPLNVASIIFP
jgi:hypothetical protein